MLSSKLIFTNWQTADGNIESYNVFLVWLVTWSLEITISQLTISQLIILRTQDNKLFPQGNKSPQIMTVVISSKNTFEKTTRSIVVTISVRGSLK